VRLVFGSVLQVIEEFPNIDDIEIRDPNLHNIHDKNASDEANGKFWY
jgi:hypothetical protein